MHMVFLKRPVCKASSRIIFRSIGTVSEIISVFIHWMKIHLLQENNVCWTTRTSLSNIMRFLFQEAELPEQLGASKSGVNDFLRAFDKCESLSYPLPPGITNYGIAELVYGSVPGSGGRNENIEYPDYEADAELMATRKNMTLVFLWNRFLMMDETPTQVLKEDGRRAKRNLTSG